MKKSSKLASIVLLASFFGIATPVNTNSTFPEKGPLEKISLESRVSGQPDTKKVYSYDEISKMVHDVYRSTRFKPNYLSEKFIREITMQESANNPNGISRKGARGLMQIMPKAWEEVEKQRSYDEYAFDPRTNLEVGTKYILWIDKKFRENYDGWKELTPKEKRAMILSAYNAGISKFEKEGWQLENMPRETRNYVGNITKRMN